MLSLVVCTRDEKQVRVPSKPVHYQFALLLLTVTVRECILCISHEEMRFLNVRHPKFLPYIFETNTTLSPNWVIVSTSVWQIPIFKASIGHTFRPFHFKNSSMSEANKWKMYESIICNLLKTKNEIEEENFKNAFKLINSDVSQTFVIVRVSRFAVK